MTNKQDANPSNTINHRNGHSEVDGLDRFFELSLDMLCTIGIDGYLKQVNSAFIQTLGWSKAELLAKPLLEIAHPDDRDAIEAKFKELDHCSKPLHFEKRFLCQDGSYKWLMWEIQPTYDETIYAMARNVTATRQTKSALEGSEERFQRFVSSLGDHIYVTEFTITGQQINQYISPNVESLTGYSVEKLREDWQFWGQSMIHPDDRDKAMAQVERFSEGQDSVVEYRLVRADGRVIWVRDSGHIEVDPQSGSLIIYGVVSDVTSRRLAEDELKQREERTRLLNKITSQAAKDPSEQLAEALELTLQLFDLEIGIISEVEGSLYTIKHFFAPGTGLEKGQIFELGDTYCSITLQAGGIIAIDQMQVSSYRQHPCYSFFQLEAYIGTPIIVRGKIYGTINFSSSKPQTFSAADRDFVVLLASWVGAVIERDEAEETLRDSEARLSEAQRMAKLGSWGWDLRENSMVWSDQLYEMFGVPHAVEVSNELYQELIHPEDRDHVQRVLERALKSETIAYEFEYRIVRKDGELRYVAGTARIQRDKNNEPIHMIGVAQDITERKLAEETINKQNVELTLRGDKLRQNVEKLQATQVEMSRVYAELKQQSDQINLAQHVARIGAWEVDVESQAMTWNNMMFEIFQIPNSGQSPTLHELTEFIHEDDRDIFLKRLQLLLRQGIRLDQEIRLTRNGEIIHTYVAGLAQEDANRKIIKIFGLFQDVTRRKQVERDLRDSQEKLSQALNIAKLAYWELDLASQNFTFNDQFYSIFRTTAEQENGYIMPASEYAQKFVHVEDQFIVAEEIQKALEVNDPNYVSRLEHRMIRDDGEVRYLGLQFRGEKDSYGQTVKIVGIVQDITDRKEAEIERERLLTEVEGAYRQYVRGEWERFLGDLEPDSLHIEHHQLEAELTQASKELLSSAQMLVTQEGKSKVLLGANQNGHSTAPAIIAPISLRGEVIGTLSLQDIDPERRWTAEEVALVETVSEQLALTIENLRLFDDTQKRATREQLTRKITDKMRAAPDIETIIQTGLTELADALRVPRTYVRLVSDTISENDLSADHADFE